MDVMLLLIILCNYSYNIAFNHFMLCNNNSFVELVVSLV